MQYPVIITRVPKRGQPSSCILETEAAIHAFCQALLPPQMLGRIQWTNETISKTIAAGTIHYAIMNSPAQVESELTLLYTEMPPHWELVHEHLLLLCKSLDWPVHSLLPLTTDLDSDR